MCFPLYAASKEIVKLYRPYLDEIDLTYTQYITMMVLWEEKHICVKDLGKKLFLDSGTLTPVLKSLEAKGFITRTRSSEDERMLFADLTEKGLQLREKALSIPENMMACVSLDPQDAKMLYVLCNKLLQGFSEK